MQRLWSIFTRFFRIGAFTIGGGVVMLGVIESEVRSIGEFTDEEISDMIVLATAIPDPITTNGLRPLPVVDRGEHERRADVRLRLLPGSPESLSGTVSRELRLPT